MNLVASILGVLKAGAAYLILDPAGAIERNKFIIAEVNAAVVLTSRNTKGLLPDTVVVEELLNNEESSCATRRFSFAQTKIDTASPAYVIYTSGSTGKPKGVLVSHAAASHGISHFSLRGKSRWLLFYNPIFSAAQRTILATLCKGGCLCLASRARLATSLQEVIEEMRIDALGLTPSILATLSPKSITSSLKQITTVGEPVSKSLLEAWVDKVEFRVSYGLSECAQLNFNKRIRKGDSPSIVGRPTDTTKAFVLIPDTLEAAAPGETGELCLTGPQLADGYLQRAAETARSFIANPFGPGRMYRTGDLAVKYTDGSFEILGRIDYQIKIHGQRLEPGEVVSVLQQHVQTTAATVVKAYIGNNDALVAAVVPAPGCDWAQLVTELRDLTRRLLPSYMIPAFWLKLEGLPLNANGKVDIREIRKLAESAQLDELLGRSHSLDKVSEPITEAIEQQVQKTWARILQLELSQVGREDSFFALGGNSMQAIQMINELRKEGIDLGGDAMFRHESLLKLRADAVIRNASEPQDETPTPFSMIGNDEVVVSLKATKGVIDAYKATPLQESLVGLTMQGSTDYLYQRTFDIKHLDLIRLKLAFMIQYSRSDILRTTFVATEAGLMQVVRTDMTLPWKEVNSTSLAEFKQEDLRAGMELGTPFIRITVLDAATLVVTMHHALFDFWSSSFLYEDVSQLYQGLLPDPRPPFKNFVRTLQHIKQEDSKSFWNEYLSEASHSALNFAPGPIKTNVARTVTHNLHRVATSSQVTAATVVYTAWAMVLSHHMASNDITFVTPLSGREAFIEDALRLDGPTLTVIPRRFNIGKDTSITNTLQLAHKDSADILKHSQYGLRLALKAAGHGADLFDTMVNILPNKDNEAQASTSDVFWIHGEKPAWQTEYTTLEVQESGEHWTVRLITDMEPLRAEYIIDQFINAISWIADKPEEPLNSLTLLTASETEVLEARQEFSENLPKLLHTSFQDMVAEHPWRVALQWQTIGAYTYSMLDRLSNQLGRHLQSQGLKRGDFACLLLDKSPLMIASILAVLKVGAAYVPLSPENPVERNLFIANEVDARLIISEGTVAQIKDLGTSPVILLDQADFASYSSGALDVPVSGSDSAYVIYTSGSTGKPKGVLIPHSAAAAAVDSMIHVEKRLEAAQPWRSLQFSNYIFDASVLEIFNTLNSGGTLCLAPTDRLHSELTEVINEMDVTQTFFTPTVARLLVPDEVPTLKILTIGGEAVTEDIANIWNNGHRLIQAYGPTECAMVVTMRDMTAGDNPRNIGSPLSTVKAFIVDKDGERIMPYGAIGEICIAGPQLSAGYWKRPDVTAAAFCKSSIPGFETMYRSGDLGRWLPNGEIECLGRKDNQVKVNGHRIELGEIEKSFMATGLLADCKAIVAKLGSKTQLAAFVVFENSDDSEIQTPEAYVEQVSIIRSKINDLAHYMYPKVVLPLGCMPRMPSGKTDRKLLTQRVEKIDTEKLSSYAFDSFGTTSAAAKVIPVATKQQAFLEQAWIKILDLPQKPLGQEADFLTMGGDSIMAINLASYIRKNGYQLSVSEIFTHTRLADMAARIKTGSAQQSQANSTINNAFRLSEKAQQTIADAGLASDDIDYTYPCPPGQVEFLQQGARKEKMWVLMATRPLPASTDISRWLETTKQLTSTNDILRTTYTQIDGTWIGVVLKSLFLMLDIIDVAGDAEKAAALDTIWHSNFVFGKPFIRYTILRHPNGTNELVVKMDHGLYDGTLLRVFATHFRELQHGRPAPEHTPFRDFVFHMHNSDKAAALDFWSSESVRPTGFQFPAIADPLADQNAMVASQLNLDAFASACGVTVPIVFQAAFQLWLSRRTQCLDVGMDYLYTGRNIDLPNPQSINGVCCNFIPLRACAKDGQSVKEYLAQTQAGFWSATENAVVGLDEIYKAAELDRRTEVNRSVFLFQPFEPPIKGVTEEDMSWVVMAKSEVRMPQPYGLVCEVRKTVDGYRIKFTYDRKAFGGEEALEGVREVMRMAELMAEDKEGLVRDLILA